MDNLLRVSRPIRLGSPLGVVVTEVEKLYAEYDKVSESLWLATDELGDTATKLRSIQTRVEILQNHRDRLRIQIDREKLK